MNNEYIETKLSELIKDVNGLKIDIQNMIRSNRLIPPGISCKVSYDSNGLILNSMKLETSDIPELDIDQIKSLRRLLDEKISRSEFKKYQLESINNTLTKGDIIASGTKVNYDDNGLIVSSSELTSDDIPELTIDKIKNLKDKLELLESHHKDDNVNIIDAGVGCKIYYDNTGRITGSDSLTVNDIPMDIINRIGYIESLLPSLSTSDVVTSLGKDVLKKLDANTTSIQPGVYTKVHVDSKGLITKGDKLTIRDLPNLTIRDIDELDTELKSKVNVTDFIDLNNTVSSMISSLSKIGDVIDIRNKLEKKANEEDMLVLRSKVDSVTELMNTLNEKIPNDTILQQLDQINHELSNLGSRISIIENYINSNKTNSL